MKVGYEIKKRSTSRRIFEVRLFDKTTRQTLFILYGDEARKYIEGIKNDSSQEAQARM